MKILKIKIEEVGISFSFDHDDIIHKEYLGHVFKLQQMDQTGLIIRETHIRVFDRSRTIYISKSIDITDVTFINKERRVGREDKLGPNIFTHFLHHSRQASLHLRMEMDLWFIDDKQSSFEIISIDSH